MPGTPWGDAQELRTRRLRPGRGASREAVAASQRDRLFAALVALAAERGYQAVRVGDLIELAGVSRAAFYEHFAGKEECLAGVVDALADRVAGAVEAAVERERSWERRMRAGLLAFMEAVAAQPAAARLCLVDAYGAGPLALERIESGVAGLRLLIERAAAESPERAQLPGEVVHGLAGGIRAVAANRVRTGRHEQLPELVEDLLVWLDRYTTPPQAIRRPRGGTAGGRYGARDPSERIMLGMAAAVAERGYVEASIADVVRHASTSVRTFYAAFDDKLEAYLATLDFTRVHAYAAALVAGRRAPTWPYAVRNGVSALCAFLADEPALASASVLGVYGAGEPALRAHDEALASFTRDLSPGYELAPDTPRIASEAIGGALDALLLDAIRSGDGPALRALGPTATFLTLTPFTGVETAARVANDSGTPRPATD